MLARIEPLWTNTAHSTLLYLLTIMAGTVSPIDSQAGRTFARTSTTSAWNANGIKNRTDVCSVTTLSGSDGERQWEAMPIHTQVDLARQPAA